MRTCSPFAGLLVAAVAAMACRTGEERVAPIPVATTKVRVRVFTEPAPVRLLASAGRFVFVGTENELERWDGEGGVLPLSAAHGLSGNQIVALAPDLDRRWVWVLTEGGLGHYDTSSEVFADVGAPPPGLNLDFAALAKEGASVAPAVDGGAWLGTKSSGLIYISAQNGWVATPIKEPIQALVRDRAGWLWLATKSGLIVRKPTGESVRVGNAEGCGIAEPRVLVELAGDRMLVIGTDEAGHERLAVGKQLQWVTYRALPEVHWDAAARHGVGAVVMAGDRVWRLGPTDASHVRPLARDGMRLVTVGGTVPGDWGIEPLDVQVPVGAVTIASANDQLLIGTRDLGTARYIDGDARPRDWLRRREMFRDATNLSVACVRAQDCWLATGARQAWHWTGERFVAGGPDQTVLAVVRDPSGAIYGLHRNGTESTLRVSRVDGSGATTWTPLPKVAIATPGATEISFARFAAPGTLWIGLRYRDGVESRAYGIAIVELPSGKVTYHRPDAPDKARLPIPMGVLDADVHGDMAWFATSEGVARLAHGKIDTWTEADGLRSEIARAVAIAADGSVYVATGAGAAHWDGKAWDFPAALRFEINDLVATRTNQIWMATEHGIAAWDGQKVRRVDTRRGLAENAILDIAVDQFDRIWARGAGSLTLVTQ